MQFRFVASELQCLGLTKKLLQIWRALKFKEGSNHWFDQSEISNACLKQQEWMETLRERLESLTETRKVQRKPGTKSEFKRNGDKMLFSRVKQVILGVR